MQNRAKVVTRRIAVATAGLAVAAAGWAFNLPANAEPSPACPQLIASYLANPSAQATLLPFLVANQCSIPTSSTSSSSTSSTSTTARPTTTTTVNPAASSCAPLSANYLANPGARSSLLPLFAEFNCPVPTIPAPTTTSSSTSSTSSSSTSSTSTTSTTVSPNASICSSLLLAYVANPAAQSSLLPVLLANNCTVPVVAGE
ncbi:MAG TPA: hypothetical protein VL337_11945 [Acidimicrobiales bacterium]|jgi:hypothetical protein|nr:hypothetical protein [Acidimicrobiales bacterium]